MPGVLLLRPTLSGVSLIFHKRTRDRFIGYIFVQLPGDKPFSSPHACSGSRQIARQLMNLSILPHIGVSMQVNVLHGCIFTRGNNLPNFHFNKLTKENSPRPKPEGVFESLSNRNYLVILVTVPAPTVRPPSRIAKRRPSSIAIGWISSTDISVVSPGITISVPAGRVITPVTSVVRK